MRNVTDRNIKDIFLQHGFKEKPQADGAYNLNPYVFEAARALLAFAAPVPPAGDVEVLASLGLTLAVLNEAFNAQDSTERLANMDVPRVMRSAFKDFERVKTEATRLTAELTLERTRADVAVADCNDAEAAGRKVSLLLSERTAERDGLLAEIERFKDLAMCNENATKRMLLDQVRPLRSELTKARELLAARPAIDAKALHAVLSALCGPVHHIRELQVCRDLPDSPIDQLQREFNDWIATPTTHNADESCGQDAEAAKGERDPRCCCPPKGFQEAWAAGPCPVHMGLRTIGESLLKENQRLKHPHFKCLACGEFHEGMIGLPCPNMTPYSEVKP
jgi:hypothetical protein